MKSTLNNLSVFLFALALSTGAQAQETIKTRIGDLSFTHDWENGYPTDATQELLFNEIDFQRACQAYIWSIPIVEMAQWQYAHKEGVIFTDWYGHPADDRVGAAS